MFPFLKTIGSLKKARLYSLIVSCAVLALVVTVFSAGIITWVAGNMIKIDIGWMDTLAGWVVGVITGIGGYFMLPALIILIAGMFQEKTIYKVESAYYPDAMRSEGPRFWPDMIHDIRFTLWAIFLNILVLPFHLFFIGPVLAIVLNTYLLGREFFESAAGYHLGKPDAKQLGRKNKTAVYGGGLVITLMTLVPIVNLFVPVLAIVWMVHVYHGLKNRRGKEVYSAGTAL